MTDPPATPDRPTSPGPFATPAASAPRPVSAPPAARSASATPRLPELTRDETLRYARHLVLPEVGEEGQRKLKDARVLCVGAGGLGSPLSLYLAAAGVGTLGLVDFDEVDPTNLQRQILHGTKDIGRPKLDSAMERLADVNPHVEVVPHHARLDSANALQILEPYDVVVDGTDNFPTRYLVNDACVLLGKPNVYGSIFRWEGQVSVFAAPEGWEMRWAPRRAAAGSERDGSAPASAGPCYRCLFRQPPPPGLVPNCAEGGVMGVLPGVIGSLQAMETIKWILGRGDPLVGRLQIFDALAMQWREVGLRRNPECPVCGDEPTQDGLIDYEVFCGVAPASAPGPSEEPGGQAPGDAPGDGSAVTTIGADELAERLETDPPPFLLDVREPWEWRIGNLEHHGAVLVPLGELQEGLDGLRGRIDPGRDVVAYCRTGARSARAARTLAEAGIPGVHNLRGGITSWAARIDPDVEVA